MSNLIGCRVCFVPLCTNTTKKPPDKVFLNGPQEEKRRIKWFEAVHRDPPKIKSNFSCCEDHFDFSIGNSNLEIQDIVARWPGCHDSNIFNNCYRKTKFEAGTYDRAILLVDGGYASTSYMMPPLENPRTAAEQLYNESQIRTRNPVERLYGVWKRRFPVLSLGMRVKSDKSLVIIIATAVLHNMLRQRGEECPPDDPELILPAPWDELLMDGQMGRTQIEAPTRRNTVRDEIINIYFQSLL